MRKGERGSEIVQFVIVMPFLLFMVFAVVQVGGTMLTINQITADLTRACRQIDAAGLSLAVDKEAFVRSELLGTATQLDESRLHISQITVSAEDEVGSHETSDAVSSIVQRTGVARISFDLAYDVPSLLAFPGLMDQRVTRHVEFSQTPDRVIEVEAQAS